MAITPLAANQTLLPDASSARGARFIIERPLSAGGFAITYLAWDQQLRDRCVIKELAIAEIMGRSGNAMVALPGRDADLTVWIQKVQREAEILHSLRSAGVVPVRATWRENGTAYFAMDYVDGIELPRQPLDGVRWETWEPVARKFLRALGAIHAAGLVHGDIKPQNVLVRNDGTPVIIDFGTARSSEDARKTRLTTIAMTPGYCPPELAVRDRAKEMGPWSDLYSWSLTVMGLVIQHRGIEGAPLEATARVALSQHGIRDAGIGEETASALREAGLPDRWVSTLMACASLYPASRPASVEAVLALLDGSPNGFAVDAKRASAPPPLPALRGGEARRAVDDFAFDDVTDLPPEQPAGGRWKWIAAAGLLIAAAAAAYFVATRPVCGNGKAEAGEGCNTCPQDVTCDSLTECVADRCTDTCGNGRPDQGETCSNCAAEVLCGASEFCDETTHACKLKCGNGRVEPEETCKSCPEDAGCCEGTWMEAGKCVGCPDGFTFLKAGEFTMGASAREIRRWAEDYPYLEPLPPAQRVRIARDFCFAVAETSNGIYRAFVGSTPSMNTSDGYPVESVTFEQAMDYANARSKKRGLRPCYDAGVLDENCNGFRLPSDAEWEYASRAGEEFSSDPGRYVAFAWTAENTYGSTMARSMPDSSTTRPNAWGICDTLGNVAEFTTQTQTCQTAEGLTIAKSASASQSQYRGRPAVRGGSVSHGEPFARPDTRIPMVGGEDYPSDRAPWVGIRLVRNIPTPLPDDATLGCTGPTTLLP